MIRPDVIVRLANLAGAKNHYERMVCQILEAEGPRPAAELVKRVAQEVYYEELRLGAGVVETGTFGPASLKGKYKNSWNPWSAEALRSKVSKERDFN